jgi:hypothetical protein
MCHSNIEKGKYERELVVALIEYMNAVVQAANIPLVIVEKLTSDPSGRMASVARRFLRLARFLPASSYLARAENDTARVSHRHRHISEQTPARIAEALDRVVNEANSGIGILSDSTQGCHIGTESTPCLAP